MSIVVPEAFRQQAIAELSSFRMDLYAAMPRRADALFELADALLCADGPVRALVELALAPEHRRSHASLYAALNRGDLDADRLRCAIAARSVPRGPGGRIVLAVDVSAWLRPDANTSDGRSFCHTYGRRENTHEMVPGWPYSFVAALESGSTSWTALLDATRLEPGADTAAVTAAQLREVLRGIFNAGHWKIGDPPVLVVADAGYDGPRLAHLLRDLPVQIVVRMRSDRVFFNPVPDDYRVGPKGGQPRSHGVRFALADPTTWRDPDSDTEHTTRRYGTARIRAWHRLHPRIWRRSAWSDHQGQLPIVEGTLIRLDVDHLPSGGTPKPVWLWYSHPTPSADDTDIAWHAFLRRFDLEHTFRFLKQDLGWTRPKLREPSAADRWTALVLAVHTQLRLARPLSADLRRPWERPQPVERLSPARVRRGFRNIHTRLPCPAAVARPSRPGAGRPPGRPNRRRAPIYDVGLALVSNQ
ncbi:NF041680 family putative transposase [Kitasatospora sp. NPDC091276]|uniref:NF041680 family putative transposase n=1 Tax=Kitasatospora sp. NPDC091276 TaxID=3155300 RepID=UPI00342EDC3A